MWVDGHFLVDGMSNVCRSATILPRNIAQHLIDAGSRRERQSTQRTQAPNRNPINHSNLDPLSLIRHP